MVSAVVPMSRPCALAPARSSSAGRTCGARANGTAGVENVLDVIRAALTPRCAASRSSIPTSRPIIVPTASPPRIVTFLRRLRLRLGITPGHNPPTSPSGSARRSHEPRRRRGASSCCRSRHGQHDPHLPLDTDTVIARGCWSAAISHAAVVAPVIAIEHRASSRFAGTLSIGTEVLAAMIVEIVRTAGPEFGRVVIVNAGGNLDAVRSAAVTCEYEGRPISVWHARLDDADAHAGSIETWCSPSTRTPARPSRPGNTTLREILDDLRTGGAAAVSPNGVLGDPTTPRRPR